MEVLSGIRRNASEPALVNALSRSQVNVLSPCAFEFPDPSNVNVNGGTPRDFVSPEPVPRPPAPSTHDHPPAAADGDGDAVQPCSSELEPALGAPAPALRPRTLPPLVLPCASVDGDVDIPASVPEAPLYPRGGEAEGVRGGGGALSLGPFQGFKFRGPGGARAPPPSREGRVPEPRPPSRGALERVGGLLARHAPPVRVSALSAQLRQAGLVPPSAPSGARTPIATSPQAPAPAPDSPPDSPPRERPPQLQLPDSPQIAGLQLAPVRLSESAPAFSTSLLLAAAAADAPSLQLLRASPTTPPRQRYPSRRATLDLGAGGQSRARLREALEASGALRKLSEENAEDEDEEEEEAKEFEGAIASGSVDVDVPSCSPAPVPSSSSSPSAALALVSLLPPAPPSRPLKLAAPGVLASTAPSVGASPLSAAAAERAYGGSGSGAVRSVLGRCTCGFQPLNRLIAKRIFGPVVSGPAGRLDVVADGRAAVEATRARAYDAVVLDLDMPRMTGHISNLAPQEAIREMRADEAAAAAAAAAQSAPGDLSPDPSSSPKTIVAWSAGLCESTRARCMAGGFDDALLKPCPTRILLSRALSPLPHRAGCPFLAALAAGFPAAPVNFTLHAHRPGVGHNHAADAAAGPPVL
eukprot:tig00020675_g12615.t1